MELLSATTGAVHNATLIYQQGEREVKIAVNSDAWYRWLESATSFTFQSAEGTFTAHKERASNRRGGWYWRAYRQQRGRLSRFYLGLSVKVTLERLQAAASHLEQPAHEYETSIPNSNTHETSIPNARGRATVPPEPPEGGRWRAAPTIIMTSRLQVPRLPMQHVPRSHVVDLLEQSVQRALTLVCAPAGSGKTTLLTEWASTTAMPVAWLSLEAADNDPARFLSYLMAALTHLDERIDTINPPAFTRDYEPVLTALLNDLARLLQRDVVLILDDYHLITSEFAHTMLLFLLEHLPSRLHLTIGTRVDPSLPLARLRARNQLSELRTPELRFVASEIEAFVHAMALTLPIEATSLLEQRTEGWIAGIQLLTLILRGHTDAVAFLHAFHGNHRFFLDYVREEILAQQTPEVQHFLLQTSILERLTGPLCDAISGQTGGQAQLAEFVRTNLFVSALDDTETWYRYHPLFAESLRAQLLKQEPDLLPELYRRASGWYEQQHWNEEACEYAFLAGDLPRAVALLEELVPHLVMQGKLTRISQWLSQLSPALIAASPSLSVASVWTVCHVENNKEQIIEQFEQKLRDDTQNNSAWIDLQRELTIMQAWASLCQDDIPRTITLIRETLSSLSNPENALRQFIAMRLRIVLSAAYRANGDLEAAKQVLLETAYLGEASALHPLNLFANIRLAELYEAQGQLRTLGQICHEMVQALDRLNNPSPLFIALTQARYAVLLYEWNHLPEAESAAQQALKVAQLLDFPSPLFSLQSHWVQVRVALAQGNGERARDLLERAERDLQRWQAPHQMPLLQGAAPAYSIPARLALASGQLEQAECWERAQGIRFDDQFKSQLSIWDYFDYITLARLLLARGRCQHNTTVLAQALTLLERLHQAIADPGYNGWSIEIQMLTALVFHAQGKTRQALTTLGPILAQAEAEGYVRLFADEGQPMAHLLAQVAAGFTTASSSYLQSLLTVILSTQDTPAETTTHVQHQPLLNRLSGRELEVLRLLAAGSSNQHIADRLVISLHTVKLHVKHIFAKLSVTNRTQAVTHAHELHLL